MRKSWKLIFVSAAFCVICWAIDIRRFVRTSGTFGAWDFVCGGMLGASVAAVLFWFLTLRKDQASRFSKYGWLPAFAFLGGAASMSQHRDQMAEMELFALGIVSLKDSALGSHTWLLDKAGMPTLVHSGHWNSSGEHAWKPGEFSRAALLLAICGATDLSIHNKGPVTDLEPLRQLKELKSIWLTCGEKADCRVFAGLPKLLDLVIEVSDPRPDLSVLRDALNLERLNIIASDTQVDLSTLKAPPKLRALALDGIVGPADGSFLPQSNTLRSLTITDAKNFQRFTAAGEMPNLTQLRIIDASKDIDLSDLPRVAPELRHLTLRGIDIGKNVSALAELKQLSKLEVHDCGTPDGPRALPRMPRLTELSLRNGNLDTLTSIPHAAPALGMLTIEQQQPALDLGDLALLTSLRHLDLSKCTLKNAAQHATTLANVRSVVLPKSKDPLKRH